MAKKESVGLMGLVAWLTGVIVSLAVGFALIGGTLQVPLIGIVNQIAGWIVVVTTLLSLVLAIVK
jgi:purine-cytosine permease-like protein